jgi:hypothetical protein
VSEVERFLERWARRKRQAANNASPLDAKSGFDDPRLTGDATEGAEHASTRLDPPPAGDSGPSLPAFDLAKLPSLDSITAETDIRAFLLPGVPAELSRAALRRAWSADPAIREFIGLADYDWDFNTEGAITGFGPLEMTEELRRQVTNMVGRSLSPDEPERSVTPASGHQITSDARENLDDFNVPAEPTPVSNQLGVEVNKGEAALSDGPSRICEEFNSSDPKYTALQHAVQSVADDPEALPRRHGKALPK